MASHYRTSSHKTAFQHIYKLDIYTSNHNVSTISRSDSNLLNGGQ